MYSALQIYKQFTLQNEHFCALYTLHLALKNTALVYSQAFAYLQAAFPSQEDELEHERLPAGRPPGTQWLRQAMQETVIKWGLDRKSGRKARNLSRIKMVKQRLQVALP